MRNISLLFLALALAACATSEPEQEPARMTAQHPSPMTEHVRAHDRIVEQARTGERRVLGRLLPRPVEVLLPAQAPQAQPGGILIHFHGSAHVPFAAEGPAAIASVNLGAGSSAYERPFEDPEVLPALLDSLQVWTGSQNRPVTISSWSAGYGAVRAILRQHAALIDHLILLDGLHTDYLPAGVTLHEGGRLNTEKLEPFADFARAAARDEKALLITHSAVFPGTYASTTETARYLTEVTGAETSAVLAWGPVGMQLLGRAERGGFTVLTFAGNTAPDHVDHLHALPALINSAPEYSPFPAPRQ
ncbi:MAG: hypothetical protein JJ896_02585 [Rhodothermales bacterium]|nr:hypothetical protein [Rhodothermales bacterium]MBO6778518.1 hypothetical protein [Rhodothermales bacterium]